MKLGRIASGRVASGWAASALALVALALGFVGSITPTNTAAQVNRATLDYRLKARSLAQGVWVVEGANADFTPDNGCNIINTGFIATGAGVVVINTGTSKLYGEQLRALITRTTTEPIEQVLHLNLHPDYFLGNQAFADVPRRATTKTRDGMAREGKAYEDNLYRLCGDWMKGTASTPATDKLEPGTLKVGSRELTLIEMDGHTDSDLVLIDKTSGVMFAGGLVFHQRMPTTPHADLKRWLASLDKLAALKPKVVVPSHGPVHEGLPGVEQTRQFVGWLDRSFSDFAAQGLDMNEVLRKPLPEAFRKWAAFPEEYVRNVAHLYKRYENDALGPTR